MDLRHLTVGYRPVGTRSKAPCHDETRRWRHLCAWRAGGSVGWVHDRQGGTGAREPEAPVEYPAPLQKSKTTCIYIQKKTSPGS